jgi:hypothetical protein
MQVFLGRGEFNDYGFRFSYCKITDITPTCSVDYSRKGVQRLKISNKLNALF